MKSLRGLSFPAAPLPTKPLGDQPPRARKPRPQSSALRSPKVKQEFAVKDRKKISASGAALAVEHYRAPLIVNDGALISDPAEFTTAVQGKPDFILLLRRRQYGCVHDS
jgi:hypothetical protein